MNLKTIIQKQRSGKIYLSYRIDMKRLPITIIPIILSLLVALLFILFVPKGGDLISKSGDFIIGYVLGYLFAITLFIDLIRLIIKIFKRYKSKK